MTSPPDHSHLFPGVPLALGSAALFALVPPVSKILLGSLGPFAVAGLLYLGAGIGLAAIRFLHRAGRRREAPLARRDLPWLGAAIAAGGVVGPVLLMAGLSFTSATNGALLLNFEALATMAIAWLWFRENVDARLLTGAAAILAGAALISWQGSGLSLDLGALLVIGACIAWGIDNNLTRRISGGDAAVIAMAKGLVAGTANLALAFSIGEAVPAPLAGAAAMLTGFLAIGLSLVFFIRALRHLGTARTGAYYSLAPFMAALLSIVVLGEPLSLRLAVAGALMGIGLWLHLAERHDHEHQHEEMEHDHLHHHDEHHQHEHDGPISEPHSHPHRHAPMRHSHVHYPDLHHRHRH